MQQCDVWGGDGGRMVEVMKMGAGIRAWHHWWCYFEVLRKRLVEYERDQKR